MSEKKVVATWIEPGNPFDKAKVIRKTVFCDEQGYTEPQEFDNLDAISYHLTIAFDDEEPVAAARIFPNKDGITYHIDRVSVLKPYRGKGVGRILLQNLEDQIRKLGRKRATLAAELTAVGFYEKLGYKIYGEQYYEYHLPVIDMEKMLE
ncbi:putative FR47-like protein [Monocercomonoides exilis]|uniref:putative FR47-like protein n=1 Tax=Monocercomonoides exilis TaxID=2049356 RepID=UPI003559F45D|nr:putative FR47-like protein [Monocercomonoides exilis]|eukprot:MONOS_12231.1-p1 / transcript=MONOS_12231.1 / gene=MONOS_12231 / organism=Monocercomonoides_exilis_PA203 / gene_product=FR47-like protein / transcript_product=FR47-like protein / location=Mono_scaffold00662:34321-34770(+) / protein_length=149 / sequence_SO=supercontig / SO=protein_coding / is_pseudo=false